MNLIWNAYAKFLYCLILAAILLKFNPNVAAMFLLLGFTFLRFKHLEKQRDKRRKN